MILIVVIIIIIILLICNAPRNMCTPLLQGGKINCKKLKFVEEGEDTCWIDTSMYALIIPEPSYKLIKSDMYKIPELYSYVKILRRNKEAIINRCTPGGGNELIFIEKMIKTLGMSYKYIKNMNRIPPELPEYLFYVNEVSRNKVPAIPEHITDHQLIALIFHVEYKNRPSMGHVACVVRCGKNDWRYYNNALHKVINFNDKNHNDVATKVSNMLRTNSERVDEILCIYCRST